MYSKVLVVFAFAAFAAANDIHEGTNNTHGLKPVFEDHYEAQWALTRGTKDVFVNTSGVITGINVTDLREAKDGEATIVCGGVGHNNVTISLKSPAVFRGYDFLIEVYSDEEVERGSRGVEPSTPEVTVEPVAESKPTDKPLTGSTGKPSTGFPTTDKAGVTTTTSKTDVTLTTSGKPDITVGPVIHGEPAGPPIEATTVPKSTTASPVTLHGKTAGLPAIIIPKTEMEIPEEIEDIPMKTKIDFDPPKINY